MLNTSLEMVLRRVLIFVALIFIPKFGEGRMKNEMKCTCAVTRASRILHDQFKIKESFFKLKSIEDQKNVYDKMKQEIQKDLKNLENISSLYMDMGFGDRNDLMNQWAALSQYQMRLRGADEKITSLENGIDRSINTFSRSLNQQKRNLTSNIEYLEEKHDRIARVVSDLKADIEVIKKKQADRAITLQEYNRLRNQIAMITGD